MLNDYADPHAAEWAAVEAVKAAAGKLTTQTPTRAVNDESAEPVPLFEPRQYRPLPIGAFPAVMRDAIEAISHYAQAPTWLAAQWVLGALNEVATPRIDAPNPARKGGQPSALFLLSLADSGAGKSTCKNLSEVPLAAHNKRMNRLHREQMRQWSDAQSDMGPREAKEWAASNPAPINQRTRINGCTVEKLTQGYLQGASAVAWVTDEGGQFFVGHSMTSDQSVEHMGTMAQIYDSGSVERQRVSDDASGAVDGRRLSMSISAQEKAVRKALDHELMREQGLGARFSLFIGPIKYGQRVINAETLSWCAEDDPRLVAWFRLLEAKLAQPVTANEYGELDLPAIALAGEAKMLWVEFAQYRDRLLADGEEFSALRAYGGRTAQAALRMAANFAFANGSGMITPDEIKGACDLADWCSYNWLVFYESDKPPAGVAQAQMLLDWLKAKEWREFDANRLVQAGPKVARKAKRRDELLAVLCEHRWLITSDGKTFKANW